MESVTTSQVQDPEDTCWGYQLIIDCFGCTEEVCCDLDYGYEFLDQICVHLQMTKQTQPYIFKTCERTFPGRPGYSGWVPIIESGIQIHTSANNRFVSIDVYSCKKFDAHEVESYVRRWFQPRSVQSQLFYRGSDLVKRSFPEGREASAPAAVPQETTLAEAGP